MKTAKTILTASILALAACSAQPALAAYSASPISSSPDDTISYNRGSRIVIRETPTMAIAITPADEYYGRPSFFVDVKNNGDAPINFGTENITATVDGEKKLTIVHTRADIEKQAQNSAMWNGLLAAAVGGMSGYSSYSATTKTPHGKYKTTASYYSPYAANAATDRMMRPVNDELQTRMAEAGQDYIQTTTLMPGEGYGGRIVISKPKAKLPSVLKMTIMGETFTFEMTK